VKHRFLLQAAFNLRQCLPKALGMIGVAFTSAIRSAKGLMSKPIAWRPNQTASVVTVPEPQKGSNTVSPCSLSISISFLATGDRKGGLGSGRRKITCTNAREKNHADLKACPKEFAKDPFR
jgi:hypothetical protein